MTPLQKVACRLLCSLTHLVVCSSFLELCQMDKSHVHRVHSAYTSFLKTFLVQAPL